MGTIIVQLFLKKLISWFLVVILGNQILFMCYFSNVNGTLIMMFIIKVNKYNVVLSSCETINGFNVY